MANRSAKNALFDAFADVGKALANGRRAELIDVLSQGERHVDDLTAEIDRGRPTRRLEDGFPEWQRAQLPVGAAQ